MVIFDENGYVKKEVFDELVVSKDLGSVLDTIADLIRYNTVLSVARAGTGHLGASLSIVEMLTGIYFELFNFNPKAKLSKNRDILVLSKGHAVPALYSTLAAKGYIDMSQLDNLRRLGGLQGHCDISTNGIEANTGSLAMGLSKAVGYALAKKRMGHDGRVIAIVGDGELQEGQVWEALLSAVSFELSNLYVVIDYNLVQTDQYVSDITRYNSIYDTLGEMGFGACRIEVPDVDAVIAGFHALDEVYAKKPKAFIAETTKGQGISFMEHTACLKDENDRYIWHNKAPNLDQMECVLYEILSKVTSVFKELGIILEKTHPSYAIPKYTAEPIAAGEPLTPAFSGALLKAAAKDKDIVVFDADLEADCGLTPFREKYPERFFEMGIMEQHMVSGASAFARLGYFPVVNSYTAFLTSRANEQIYNYASEGGRGLVVGHMSGVIPAAPGKSHQAYRDIACIKNIPGILMYQPATPNDCSDIMERAFGGKLGNITYMRMSMAPPAVKLPDAPAGLPVGMSYEMREGKDAVIFGVGPVILGECILASQALEEEGIKVEVRNHPWLNAIDHSGLRNLLCTGMPVIIVEDHYKDGGFGESFFAAAAKEGMKIKKSLHIAIEDFTTTGFRSEALKHFGMDKDSIAKKVKELLV